MFNVHTVCRKMCDIKLYKTKNNDTYKYTYKKIKKSSAMTEHFAKSKKSQTAVTTGSRQCGLSGSLLVRVARMRVCCVWSLVLKQVYSRS